MASLALVWDGAVALVLFLGSHIGYSLGFPAAHCWHRGKVDLAEACSQLVQVWLIGGMASPYCAATALTWVKA